ncbi:MAG: sodium:calcium antiporter [Candidatus Micrarchaeota archaeon]
MVFFDFLVLLFFLAVLAKSSSYVVDNAIKLSTFFGINQMALGFLLISFSTSLPELSVSVISSTLGEGAIAVGNVFGSNISNILLILGIAAFLYGIKLKKANLKDIALVLVLTTLISLYIIFNSLVLGGSIGFFEGFVLLLLFIFYVYSVFSKRKFDLDGRSTVTKKEALSSFIYFCFFIILVLISSGFVVEYSVTIAETFGLAKSFIGATIIAIGTSLPELSVDLQAVRKGHYGLAIGDAIGSNMMNLTLVLGVAVIINPVSVVLHVLIIALLFAIVANIFLFYFASTTSALSKNTGALFLVVYLIYIVTIFYFQAGVFTGSVP